jgi:3-deoxy-D-arabino-heptulosonate 7-phosphate (DAHP) synthase class II
MFHLTTCSVSIEVTGFQEVEEREGLLTAGIHLAMSGDTLGCHKPEAGLDSG